MARGGNAAAQSSHTSRNSITLLQSEQAPAELPLPVQRATLTLRAVIALAAQFSDSIFEGWRNVVEVVLRMHVRGQAGWGCHSK